MFIRWGIVPGGELSKNLIDIFIVMAITTTIIIINTVLNIIPISIVSIIVANLLVMLFHLYIVIIVIIIKMIINCIRHLSRATLSPHSGHQHYWPVNYFVFLPAQKSQWQNVCKIAGSNVEPTSGYFVIFITQFPMFFFFFFFLYII